MSYYSRYLYQINEDEFEAPEPTTELETTYEPTEQPITDLNLENGGFDKDFFFEIIKCIVQTFKVLSSCSFFQTLAVLLI